jgi:hypothetical protein
LVAGTFGTIRMTSSLRGKHYALLNALELSNTLGIKMQRTKLRLMERNARMA